MDWKTCLLLFLAYFASGVLNSLLAFRTTEQWQAYLLSNPRGAAAIKVLRKVGLDLPGLLRIVLPALQNAIARLSGRGRAQ